MKQAYRVFKVGKKAVSGVLEAGQFRYFGFAAGMAIFGGISAPDVQAQTVTNWADFVTPTGPVFNSNIPSGSERTTPFTYWTGATGSAIDPVTGDTISLTVSGEKAYPFESGGLIYCVTQGSVRSRNSCAAHVERAIWLGM
jgi:hypothetical protein